MTCQVMDRVAQYMTVFSANLTNSPRDTPICEAMRSSLCNSLICTLPNNGGTFNYTFLPCLNPVGVYGHLISRIEGYEKEFTTYSNLTVDLTSDHSVEFTLDQTKPNEVGFAVSSVTS